MKRVIPLLIIIFTLSANGQNREEIISLMNEYGENYGKPNYSFDFIDGKLNPGIIKIEKIICENNDTILFDCFLEMILKTKDSANETPSNILGGIFICNPGLVKNRLTEKYKDEFLINLLEFGFNNRTYDRKEEIKNYAELEKQLNQLNNN
ncbi:hypothetical protein ACE01N_04215 [Saccharicrinis sp. FJH2]|uniref:hypothetical protein n=1 Tax=Saccharicrinis sp. FJH65 TaxID=3344659 RepID=UPI0035F2F2DF